MTIRSILAGQSIQRDTLFDIFPRILMDLEKVLEKPYWRIQINHGEKKIEVAQELYV